MTKLTENPDYFIEKLKKLQAAIRQEVTKQTREKDRTELASIAREGHGDVVFKLDVPAEEILEKFCSEWGKEKKFVLVAEGIGRRVFPENAKEQDCEFILIVDPIDGTRPLMYDLRSAWSLSGIAPNKGIETNLSDIEIAVQTELPVTKQNLGEVFYAVKGKGAYGELVEINQNKIIKKFQPEPSNAETIRNGFFIMKSFFLLGNIYAAKAEQKLLEQEFNEQGEGKACVFDDQYISSAGQLYCLATGRYRFVSDLRPWLNSFVKADRKNPGLTAHPYDLCTELIAKEAGAIITGIDGKNLKNRLDTESPVLWIGHANSAIRKKIEPRLLSILKEISESAKEGTLNL